jgi:hypothetical protein
LVARARYGGLALLFRCCLFLSLLLLLFFAVAAVVAVIAIIAGVVADVVTAIAGVVVASLLIVAFHLLIQRQSGAHLHIPIEWRRCHANPKE